MKKTLSAYERVLYQLTVCFQLQRRRSTLKFGYACLTLKERPKVKSDHIKRFQAHHFLYVGIPSQTSRTNNKWVISTLKFLSSLDLEGEA